MIKQLLSKVPKKTLKIVKKNNTTHAFITGDSLKILRFFPKNSIDLIITDPPYNVGLDYGPYYKDKKKWDEYFSWCKERLVEIARVLNLSLIHISEPTRPY